ncbi:MAG: AI-2E family transporter [Candidatus Wallbacteria bacterium]|nr:AI-2E family transporter [Candidatus Wallbacteria bacterium]
MTTMADETPRAVLQLPLPHRSTVAMVLALGLPMTLTYSCPGVMAPFVLSGVLAYLLNPVVTAIQHLLQKLPRSEEARRRLRPAGTRTIAVLMFFLWLVTVVALFGFPLIVSAGSNLYALADKVSARSPVEYQTIVRKSVAEYQARLETIPLVRENLRRFTADANTIGTIGTILDAAARFVGRQLQTLASLSVSIFAAGASLAVVPLILFYMLTDWERMRAGVENAIPQDYRPWFDDFVHRLDVALGGYIRAQLIICLLYGAVMTLGLLVLGIPYATLLGPLSGAACFVPYLGAALGVGAACLIVLLQWGFSMDAVWSLGGLLLLFLAVQALDGLFFQPRIMGGHVGLHPIAILFALALGQNLAGLYGLLLALPGAAFLRVVATDARRVLYEPRTAT